MRRDNVVTVVRGGINWRLDLSEGIDFSIYFLGRFEQSTAKALDRLIRSGDTVFDIGANIGAHSLPIARAVGPGGRLFSFEPTAFAFGKLKQNLSLNPDLEARVSAYQLLLTDDPGATIRSEIYSSWPLRVRSDAHPKHKGQLATTAGATPETLDAFSDRQRISRLDVIKIDVDGSEYPVLHGGVETLRKLRPVILMELSPYVHVEQGNSFGALIDLLGSIGYSLEEVGTSRKLPLDTARLAKLIPDGASINAIAAFATSA